MSQNLNSLIEASKTRERNNTLLRVNMPRYALFAFARGLSPLLTRNRSFQYITANGGYVNAFTDTSNTKYIFSVSASALPGALDRFSTMFHSPLFTASATMRELQAVNSEHKKNDQDDTWRIYQVSKSLSRAGHVWGKFGNGNLESLTEAARAAERSNRNEIKDTVKEESVDSAKVLATYPDQFIISRTNGVSRMMVAL